MPEIYGVYYHLHDACNVIGERVYHMEVQSRNDKTMVLRMVEYDFVIGLAGADKENGKYHIRFPRSCVIYLRHNGTTPQEEEMELEFQNGQVVYYRVPTVLMLMHKVADYLLREHEEFKEEVGAVMGGKVLPLPSDAWREANERAHAEGLQEGLQQGLQGQHQILVRNIENAMQNFRIDLETACKGLGTTVGEYQTAKEALKASVRRTTG